jgi:hypothetical protein
MDRAESATDAEAIRLQLERILSSGVFVSARRSQAFLRYVVEKSILGPVHKAKKSLTASRKNEHA